MPIAGIEVETVLKPNSTLLQNEISAISRRTIPVNLSINNTGLSLGRITGQMDEFQRSMSAANARVLAFGASASAIVAVSEAFRALISNTIEVQKRLADINAIFNGSASTIAGFGGQIFDAARSTGKSFEEASSAAVDLARQGLGAEETVKRLNDALILSRLTGLSASESVEALTAAVNSFSRTGIDATEVINKLATVDTAFSVSGADLVQGLKVVGSAAADAGVSFNQLLGLLTSARQITGRSGSVIGGALNTVFTRLQRQKVVDVLKTVGIGETDESGNLKSSIELYTELGKVYDTLSPRVRAFIAEQVGGVRQLNILKATLADLGRQYSIYSQVLNVAESATDEAQKRNEKLNQTFAAQFNALGLTIQQFSSNLGNLSLSGVFTNLLSLGDGLFGALNGALQKNAENKSLNIGEQIGVGLIKGIASVIQGPALVVLGGIIVGVFKKLGADAFGALKTVLNPNIRNLEQVNQLLAQDKSILQGVLEGSLSIEQAQKRILDIYIAQNRQLQAQRQIGAGLSGGKFKSALEESAVNAAIVYPNFYNPQTRQFRAGGPTIYPDRESGLLSSTLGFARKNAFGVGTAIGVGADIASGFFPDNSKGKAVTETVGNIASLATIGTLIAPGVGTAVGALAGLALSAKDLAGAFDSLKINARKSSEQAQKDSTNLTEISDLIRKVQQEKQQIEDITKSGNSGDASDLARIKGQRLDDLTALIQKMKDAGLDTSFINAKSTIDDFAGVIKRLTDKLNQSNFTSVIDSFLAGGDRAATDKDVGLAIANQLKNNPAALKAFSSAQNDDQRQAALLKYTKLSKQEVDSLFFKQVGGTLSGGPGGFALSAAQEDVSSRGQAVTKAVLDSLDSINKASKLETESKTGLAQSNKQQAEELAKASAQAAQFREALLKLTQSTLSFDQFLARGSRNIETQRFNTETKVNSLNQLQELAKLKDQPILANDLANSIARAQTAGNKNLESSQNQLDLRKGIGAAFQEVFSKLEEDAIKQSITNPESAADSLNSIRGLRDQLNSVIENSSPDKLSSGISDITDKLKSFIKTSATDQESNFAVPIAKLTSTTQKELNDFAQKELSVRQKELQELSKISANTEAAAIQLKISQQNKLFGGFDAFTDPTKRQAGINAIAKAETEKAAALENFKRNPTNINAGIEYSRATANAAKIAQDFIGAKFDAPGSFNASVVSKGIDLDINKTIDQLVRNTLGNKYKDYFGSTRPSEFIDRGGKISSLIGGQAARDLDEQIGAIKKVRSGAGETQTETALLDANTKATDANTKAILDLSKNLISKPNSSGSAPISVSLNIAISGTVNPADMKRAAQEAFNIYIPHIKDALKTGNTAKLNLPPKGR